MGLYLGLIGGLVYDRAGPRITVAWAAFCTLGYTLAWVTTSSSASSRWTQRHLRCSSRWRGKAVLGWMLRDSHDDQEFSAQPGAGRRSHEILLRAQRLDCRSAVPGLFRATTVERIRQVDRTTRPLRMKRARARHGKGAVLLLFLAAMVFVLVKTDASRCALRATSAPLKRSMVPKRGPPQATPSSLASQPTCPSSPRCPLREGVAATDGRRGSRRRQGQLLVAQILWVSQHGPTPRRTRSRPRRPCGIPGKRRLGSRRRREPACRHGQRHAAGGGAALGLRGRNGSVGSRQPVGRRGSFGAPRGGPAGHGRPGAARGDRLHPRMRR